MWWLHTIWGYKVISKHSRPHTGAFGLTFEDEYLLLPRHRQ